MWDLLIVVVMYAIGSVPFAYILTLRAGYDLRVHGSRNIGARNAYEVTRRKDIGVAVLVLDLLKGLLPALILNYYLDEPAVLPLAVVMLVVGHCYPVWLRFHGGRGLATAAGIGILVAPITVEAWLVVYAVSRVVSNDVHVRTVIALAAALVVVFVLQDSTNLRLIFLQRSYEDYGIVSLRTALALVIGVIFTRHIIPLKAKFLTREV